MFDLEIAIATWRQQFRHRRTLLREDVDELERHVRDQTAHLVREGWSVEAAYREAVRDVGDFDESGEEYGKIYWGKLRRKARLLDEIVMRLTMLKSYLKITLRNLRRHPLYAFLNVAGLAVGLAACLVIGLFIRHKLSYDRFHPNAERVYRVVQAQNPSEGGIVTTPPGLAAALETHFPEVEHATVMNMNDDVLLERGDIHHFIDAVALVDEKFLDVFPYKLVVGNPETAFTEKDRIVLTVSEARRLFGDEDPMGQVLRHDARRDLTVSGIIEDPPANAHFRFRALRVAPGSSIRAADPIDWNFFAGHVYFSTVPDADPVALQEKLTAWELANREGYGKGKAVFHIQPVTRIHLFEKMAEEIQPQSDVRYLYLFGGIALVILLIACINYMNLATARSLKRAKEVGVRKVVGARCGQLIAQFIGESVWMVCIAVPLAIGLAALARPVVEQIAGEDLALPLLDLKVLPVLVGVVLLVGLAAGSYPAFVLSRFQPGAVLYARGVLRQGGQWLRQGLVFLQFAAAVVLIVATLVVQFQLDYVQQARLGFDEDRLITMSNYDVLPQQYDAFREALMQQARVEAVTSAPEPGVGHMNMSRWIGPEVDPNRWMLHLSNVGLDYTKTLGLRIVEGGDFSAEITSGENKVVLLNESAVAKFGLEGEVVGQQVMLGEEHFRVVGVVDDFHNQSLHEPVAPHMFLFRPEFNWTVLARLSPGEMQEALAQVEQVWTQFIPHRPFQFAFLDQRIQQQYLAEQKLGKIFGIFSGLAIVVACLGLFGLAAFTTQQRTKEIGIRKVLGASIGGVVALLAKDFVRLVLVAFVAGAPLAWWAMRTWLQDFAYHIPLSWELFAIAGACVLLIALLTVSYQAWRAATTNPVESLRYE